MSDVWHAILPEEIAWFGWEDEIVLYAGSTGATHHLSPVASELMRTLLARPSGVAGDELARGVAALVDAADLDKLRTEIDRALATLEELQLVSNTRRDAAS
jgi:PqqD family protein of HPr-rel-A system